jgi:acetyl esterase/lipase
VVAVLLGTPLPLRAQDEKATPKTHVYKTAVGCPLHADVYAPAADGPRPVVVWLHGGALIMGHRGQIDRALLPRLLQAGYAVVSLDYRLAPETKLPAILDDVRDGCGWVREQGPQLFHADPRRLVIMGGSAGGYLTLAMGARLDPPPVALVSFWGYGDIAGAWYSRPDPFYSRLPPVSRDEAYGAVGKAVLSESKGANNRGRFYLYCRQHGLWPKEVAGLDPERQADALKVFCPVHRVTPHYPPTLLIHGTQDTDVPYEQSAAMARELARCGVRHELLTVEGAGHGLAGATPTAVAQTRERILTFLKTVAKSS